MTENILVFDRKFLNGFKESSYEGFYKNTSRNFDWFVHVLGNSFFEPRSTELEEDQNLLQVIPYFSVTYQDQILTYTRAGSEGRLHNKLSLGFGGHISSEDFNHNTLSTIERSIKRESYEELGINQYEHVINCFDNCFGFINLDKTPVDKVHFGVCFSFVIFDRDKKAIKFSDETKKESWVDIDKKPEGLEGWSEVFWDNMEFIYDR